MRLLENDKFLNLQPGKKMLLEMPTYQGPRNGGDRDPRAPLPPLSLKKYIKEK